MISLAKAAADPAGHYARPDVTRLLLDRTPGDRVVARRRAGRRGHAGERRRAARVAAARRRPSCRWRGARPEEEAAMESAIPDHLQMPAHAATAACRTTTCRLIRRSSRATQPSVEARGDGLFRRCSSRRARRAAAAARAARARRGVRGRRRPRPLGPRALHRRGRLRQRDLRTPIGTIRRASTPGSPRTAALDARSRAGRSAPSSSSCARRSSATRRCSRRPTAPRASPCSPTA